MVTSCPPSASLLTTWLPMKPAPPVTIIFKHHHPIHRRSPDTAFTRQALALPTPPPVRRSRFESRCKEERIRYSRRPAQFPPGFRAVCVQRPASGEGDDSRVAYQCDETSDNGGPGPPIRRTPK